MLIDIIATLADLTWSAFWPCARLCSAALAWWCSFSLGMQAVSTVTSANLMQHGPSAPQLSRQMDGSFDLWREDGPRMLESNASAWTLAEAVVLPLGTEAYNFVMESVAQKVTLLLRGWALARLRR